MIDAIIAISTVGIVVGFAVYRAMQERIVTLEGKIMEVEVERERESRAEVR